MTFAFNSWYKRNIDDIGFQLVGLLLIFFVCDSLNVFLFKTGIVDNSMDVFRYIGLSSIPRGFVFVALIYYEFKRPFNSLKLALIIVLIMVFLSSLKFNSLYSQFTWFVLLSKYLFPFFLYSYFKQVTNAQLIFARRIFICLTILQVCSVLLGWIFNIKFLSSYGLSRFGFSGLIFSVNEVAFFYSIASVFSLYLWQKERNWKYLLLYIAIVSSGFVLGAKAFFLSFFFLSSLLLWIILKKYGPFSMLIILAISLSVITLFVLSSSFIEFHVELFNDVGLLSGLSSLRSDLVLSRLPELISKWKFNNFLFGGQNPQHFLVEMDLIDLFTFSGIIGTLAYFVYSKKTVFYNLDNIYMRTLFFCWLSIGALAGHVFHSGVNALYFVFVVLYIGSRYKFNSKVTVN